jgi:uncharacterized protein with ACT and thioredoxin-like domain
VLFLVLLVGVAVAVDTTDLVAQEHLGKAMLAVQRVPLVLTQLLAVVALGELVETHQVVVLAVMVDLESHLLLQVQV